MKEHPIIFSTEMVKAILAGTKTMTRRIVKMPKDKIKKAEFGYTAFTPAGHISFRATHANGKYGESFLKLRYGLVGELLWVRETWNFAGDTDKFFFKAGGNSHLAGYENNPIEEDYKYRPSIHMPKAAARIWLKIKSVRIEKLQDISDGDVAREGVTWNEPLQMKRDKRNCKSPAQRAFRSLWDKINGEESWLQNPWVWVIEFEVVSTSGSPAACSKSIAGEK